MEPIPFSKISGNGNDFILIDNRAKVVDTDDCLDFVTRVCRRAISVGADGVIFIERDPAGELDFAWRFFNSDGSEAEMCGNGGRCAARFAHAKGIAGKQMAFRTIAGVIRAEITGERSVKLQLTPPKSYKPGITVNFEKPQQIDGKDVSDLNMALLDTGVPHAVAEVSDIESVDMQALGSAVRYHSAFAPKGANANFVQVTGKDSLLIRTYERGVEGETLACGTGAVAAAIIMALAGRVEPPVHLITRSKDPLIVHFDTAGGLPSTVYFEGAVRWNYDGTLLPESLL